MQRLSAKDTSRLGQPDLGRECLLKNFFKQFRLEGIGSGLVVGCMTPDTRVAGSVTVPDLGQDCLQRLSVRRNTSRERVNTIFWQIVQTD